MVAGSAEQLQALWALDGGDGSFLASLVESFLESAGRALPALAAAVQAGDIVALAQEAHRFKGEAATLGATGLAELCHELEAFDSPLDVLAASALVERIGAEMERATVMLRATLAEATVTR